MFFFLFFFCKSYFPQMFFGRMKRVHCGCLSTLLSSLIQNVHSSGNNGILGSRVRCDDLLPPLTEGSRGVGEITCWQKICLSLFLGWGRPGGSAKWRWLILLVRNLDMFWALMELKGSGATVQAVPQHLRPALPVLHLCFYTVPLQRCHTIFYILHWLLKCW